MAESDFSWLKTASFIGALVLLVLAFVMIAGGAYLIEANHALHGVASIIGGGLSIAGAVAVYKNYQRKSDKKRYGDR